MTHKREYSQFKRHSIHGPDSNTSKSQRFISRISVWNESGSRKVRRSNWVQKALKDIVF